MATDRSLPAVTTPAESVSPVDARLLAIAIALEPALTLARITGLGLDELQDLVAVGYLKEHQRRGLSLRGMEQRLGKSLRTLARISKQANAESPPLAESERIGWRRRLVEALMGGARSEEELARSLPKVGAEDLEAALRYLTDEGIVESDGDRYVIQADQLLLVREDLDHRLDSLRQFLGVVAQIVYLRFFRNDQRREAFGRVMTFSVHRERLVEIRERVYEALLKEVFAADAEAEGAPDALQASIVFGAVEAPTDLPWRRPK